MLGESRQTKLNFAAFLYYVRPNRYGNRWLELAGGSQSLTFNSNNNRITSSGYSYDDAGNLLSDGAHTYTYDAENKIRTVDGVTANVYDGEGQRVRKLAGEDTRFVYDVGGQMIMELNGATGALLKEYVYGGGSMATIAHGVKASAAVMYVTSDHLGTPRVSTKANGTVAARHDYKPFGEEIFAGTGGRTTTMGYSGTDGVRQKFTQKERDGETRLDYFLARYYSSSHGRFLSPDPYDVNLERQLSEEAEREFPNYISQPQHWNHYSYVLNNPMEMEASKFVLGIIETRGWNDSSLQYFRKDAAEGHLPPNSGWKDKNTERSRRKVFDRMSQPRNK